MSWEAVRGEKEREEMASWGGLLSSYMFAVKKK